MVRNRLVAALLVGTAPLPVFAEEAPTAPAAQDGGISDIVVTAQRREERLQEIPAAITAMSGEDLIKANVLTTEDLGKVTPGFYFGRSNFVSQPTIRGIGTRGANAGDESVTPIFIDGVYQPFQFASLFSFNNVERIEVLKGPQSILYGRNATGGAINIITATPSIDPKLKLRASYGNFDTVDISAYASAGSGRVAGDVAVNYYDDNGYVRDLVSGGKTADRTSFGIRSKLHAELGEQMTATLALGYMKANDRTGANQPINGNTLATQPPATALFATRKWESAVDIEPRARLKQYAASLTLRYDMDALAITSITGYQDNSYGFAVDSDASTLNSAGFGGTITSESLYQELYAQSNNDGPFEWLVGGVYFHDDSAFRDLTVYAGGNVAQQSDSFLGTKSFAIYGQGTYDFTDQLSLIAGLRYTTEKKDYIFQRYRPTALTTPVARANFDKLTPSVTLRFQASRDLQVYGRYSQAFKSGLFNSTAAPVPANDPRPVQPETTTQYEIGIKSDPAHWLRLNLAAYYTDYKDLQLTARDAVLNTPILTNAAKAKIKGIELDAQIRPVSNFGFTVALSLLDGEYRDFGAGQAFDPRPGGGNVALITDLSGNTLPKAPSTMLSLSSDYSFPAFGGDIVINGNLSYQSRVFWDPGNRISQGGYTLLGGDIGWRSPDERISITLYGQNLTNKYYSVGGNIGTAASHMAMGRPRSYGIRLGYSM